MLTSYDIHPLIEHDIESYIYDKQEETQIPMLDFIDYHFLRMVREALEYDGLGHQYDFTYDDAVRYYDKYLV